MDVTSVMRRAASFFADREAVVHGVDRLTFARAWERGCRLANGLIALGLKPGERVAVLEDNSKEAADFFLGAGIANLVRVPLYPRNSREAHMHMVGHTGCTALLVGGNYAHEVADFKRQLADLRHILVRDEGYERWLAAQSPVDPLLRTPTSSATPAARPAAARASRTPTRRGSRATETGSTTTRPSSRATSACTWGRSATPRAICSCRCGCGAAAA